MESRKGKHAREREREQEQARGESEAGINKQKSSWPCPACLELVCFNVYPQQLP